MPLKLICEHAIPNEQVFTAEIIKIGKLSSSHFRIEHGDVSRMHAVIEEDGDGGYFLIDLGSHSGTKVDGQKVNKASLIDGSLIELGHVVVRVYTEDVEVPKEPVPAVGIKATDAYFAFRKAVGTLQEKLSGSKVVGESGGGLVKIEMSGEFEPVSVYIDDLAIGEGRGMVEDLILAALRDVVTRLRAKAEKLAKEA